MRTALMKFAAALVILTATCVFAQSGQPSRSSTSTSGVATTTTVYANGANTDVNIASLTSVVLVTKALTVAAGDTILVEVWGTRRNGSFATRVFKNNCTFCGMDVITTEGLGQTSTANLASFHVTCKISVSSTSLTRLMWWGRWGQVTTAGTGVQAGSPPYYNWNTTASNCTGAQTVTVGMGTNDVSFTDQVATVESYRVTHMATSP